MGRTCTKLGLMCLAQGHNAVTPLRLELVSPWSGVKHSTTEPMGSYDFLSFADFFFQNNHQNVKQFGSRSDWMLTQV